MESRLRHFLKTLKSEGVRENIPNISFHTGEILQFFIASAKARSIFEIGCANGFSTILLAEAVQKNNGKVLTCDVSEPSFRKAQANIYAAGLEDFVEFRFGNALGILKPREKFDFIFIDGEKKRTHEFFLLAFDHLDPNGIICIDDTGKFPEKMRPFFELRNTRKDIAFFEIPVDRDDNLTIAFRILRTAGV